MKKGNIFLLVIMSTIVIIGIVTLCIVIDSVDDVRIYSINKETEFCIKDIADSRVRHVGIYYSRFETETNKFDEAIRKNDCFLYQVDKNSNVSKFSVAGYLLYKDGHYFYFTFDRAENNYVNYKELVVNIYDETESCELYLPIYSEEALEKTDEYSFSRDDTVGLKSFDDLKEYYGRIDSNYYRIDEAEEAVYLKSIYSDEEERAIVCVTDEGLKLVLIDTPLNPKM